MPTVFYGGTTVIGCADDDDQTGSPALASAQCSTDAGSAFATAAANDSLATVTVGGLDVGTPVYADGVATTGPTLEISLVGTGTAIVHTSWVLVTDSPTQPAWQVSSAAGDVVGAPALPGPTSGELSQPIAVNGSEVVDMSLTTILSRGGDTGIESVELIANSWIELGAGVSLAPGSPPLPEACPGDLETCVDSTFPAAAPVPSLGRMGGLLLSTALTLLALRAKRRTAGRRGVDGD